MEIEKEEVERFFFFFFFYKGRNFLNISIYKPEMKNLETQSLWNKKYKCEINILTKDCGTGCDKAHW